MRAILEFNLPEDDREYRMAIDGQKYVSTLEDIANLLRNRIKYESENMTEKEFAVYEFIYDKFYDILRENKISIFE